MEGSKSEFSLMRLNDNLNNAIALISSDESNLQYHEQFNQVLKAAFEQDYIATARHIYIEHDYLKAFLMYSDQQNMNHFVKYKLGLSKVQLFQPTEEMINELAIPSGESLYTNTVIAELLYTQDEKVFTDINPLRSYIRNICNSNADAVIKNAYILRYVEVLGDVIVSEQVHMDDVEMILAHVTEKDHMIEGFPFLAVSILAKEQGSQEFDTKKLKELLKHDFSHARNNIKQEYIDEIKHFALKALIIQEPSYISHMTEQESAYVSSLPDKELMVLLESAHRNAKLQIEKEAVVKDISVVLAYLNNVGFIKELNALSGSVNKVIHILSKLVNDDVPDLMKSAIRAYYAFELQLSLPKITVPKFLKNAIDRVPNVIDEIINVHGINMITDVAEYKVENILVFPVTQLEKLYDAYISQDMKQSFEKWLLGGVAILASFAEGVRIFDHATAKEKIGHIASELFTANVASVYETVSNMQSVMQIKGMSKLALDSEAVAISR